MAASGYENLVVWRRAMDVAEAVYGLARLMPVTERYAMTSQMLKSAVSVAADLAEGYQRGTRRDYAHFVSIARSSLAETETYLKLALRLSMLPPAEVLPVLEQAEDLSPMLTRLRLRLIEPRPSTPDA